MQAARLDQPRSMWAASSISKISPDIIQAEELTSTRTMITVSPQALGELNQGTESLLRQLVAFLEQDEFTDC